MNKIAVIGAGFTGLTIANFLKKYAQVTIFEKSRGSGGRMATRYAELWEFDHGAPFFTAESHEFKGFLQPLIEQKIVSKWDINFATKNLHANVCPPAFEVQKDYFIGVNRMNSIGKYLAKDLNIKYEIKITKLEYDHNKWRLIDDRLNQYEDFDFVITATPPLQAAEILPEDCSYIHNLKNFNMLPTFSVMLGFNEDITKKQEWNIACLQNSKIDKIIANHTKPFRKIKPSFVVLSTHDWAKSNIDKDKNDIGKEIISELEIIFSKNITPDVVQVHRWLYAEIEQKNETQPFFIDNQHNVISCGDWCLGGGVESAFKSGFEVSKCFY